jgi:DNA-binding transcriptional regulator/RsmH inhibitor MraZ
MKEFFKNLVCKLKIHFPSQFRASFFDSIGGNVVYNYECKNCGVTWMTTSKYSRFKVYTGKYDYLNKN